jgi:hypothetical protein
VRVPDVSCVLLFCKCTTSVRQAEIASSLVQPACAAEFTKPELAEAEMLEVKVRLL